MTARKETPCLFNGDMVRAILSGAKTQTRRLIKPQPEVTQGEKGLLFAATPNHRTVYAKNFVEHYSPLKQPGDLIWVRETWARFLSEKHSEHIWGNVVYRATHAGMNPECEGFSKWRPSIHMPKWAARIWLEIVDVKVERCSEISEEDAIAEGVVGYKGDREQGCKCGKCAIDDFCSMWTSIYGPDSWDNWVWVYRFKRVERL